MHISIKKRIELLEILSGIFFGANVHLSVSVGYVRLSNE